MKKDTKTRLFIFTLFTISFAILLGGCSGSSNDNIIRPEGATVSRRFPVGNFTAIDIGPFADVAFRHANERSIVVEAAENLIDFANADVVQGVLITGINPGSGIGIEFGGRRPQITIYAPSNSITGVTLDGGVTMTDWAPISAHNFFIETRGSSQANLDLILTGNLDIITRNFSDVELNFSEVGDLTIDTSGSSNVTIASRPTIAGNLDIIAGNFSDVNLELATAEDVTINATGSSRVTLLGSAQSLNIEAGNFAQVVASNLPVRDAVVFLSGSSRVGVYATEALSGFATSFSQLQYRGMGENVHTVRTSGSATVTQGPGNFHREVNQPTQNQRQ